VLTGVPLYLDFTDNMKIDFS